MTGYATKGDGGEMSVEVGSEAPDFELKDQHGKRVRLSQFRGKKVLLVTWASW